MSLNRNIHPPLHHSSFSPVLSLVSARLNATAEKEIEFWCLCSQRLLSAGEMHHPAGLSCWSLLGLLAGGRQWHRPKGLRPMLLVSSGRWDAGPVMHLQWRGYLYRQGFIYCIWPGRGNLGLWGISNQISIFWGQCQVKMYESISFSFLVV